MAEFQMSDDHVKMVKDQLEQHAKEIQEKMGGSEAAHVVTSHIVIPSSLSKKSAERISSLEAENAKLQKHVKQVEFALDQANKELNRVNQTAADSQTKAEEKLEAVEGKIRLYQSKLSEAKETNAQIEKDLREVQNGVHNKENKLNDVSNELSAKHGDLTEASAGLEEKDGTIGILSQRADAKESSISQLQQQVESLNSEKRSLEEELTLEKVKTSTFESEMARMKELLGVKEGDAKISTDRISDLLKTLDSTTEEKDENIAHLQELEKILNPALVREEEEDAGRASGSQDKEEAKAPGQKMREKSGLLYRLFKWNSRSKSQDRKEEASQNGEASPTPAEEDEKKEKEGKKKGKAKKDGALVMQLAATKAKAEAGERAAEELVTKENELEEKDKTLKELEAKQGELEEKNAELEKQLQEASEKQKVSQSILQEASEKQEASKSALS